MYFLLANRLIAKLTYFDIQKIYVYSMWIKAQKSCKSNSIYMPILKYMFYIYILNLLAKSSLEIF